MKHTHKTRSSTEPTSDWIPVLRRGERQIFLFGMVCLVAGLAIGYMIRGLSPTTTAAPALAPRQVTLSPAGTGSQVEFNRAGALLEAALKSNPKNLSILIQLGNLYSDYRVLPKAIKYYSRALDVDPNNVKVRTDLGTVYWYAGLPGKAVGEYKGSLRIDPTHFQTLFNLGMVYEKGFKDHARAVATWEKLLQTHPQDPNRKQVEQLIESAKQEEAASKTRNTTAGLHPTE